MLPVPLISTKATSSPSSTVGMYITEILSLASLGSAIPLISRPEVESVAAAEVFKRSSNVFAEKKKLSKQLPINSRHHKT